MVLVRAVLAILLAGAALYLSFELGRLQAGYSLLDARRASEAYEQALAARGQKIDDLERQIAILETSREIDRETYSSIETNLAELQDQIQEQEEEIAFYRGIVTPGDGVAGLRIQNVEIEPGEFGATHLLRILLVQAIVQNDRVTGSVRLSLSGMLDGREVELGLDDLGVENGGGEIPYAFRYFQTLQLGLTLPEDLEPEAIEIQVWPRAPRGETIVQSFPWATVSG
ncbi:MAG: hypothetical protein PVH89_02140 [Gammaproteobacteria bacterium]|jgi:hypothetical protein